jgi:hypothetical protein
LRLLVDSVWVVAEALEEPVEVEVSVEASVGLAADSVELAEATVVVTAVDVEVVTAVLPTMARLFLPTSSPITLRAAVRSLPPSMSAT